MNPPPCRFRLPRGLDSRPMKALRSFSVKAELPPSLEPLGEVALNLRWTWIPQAIDLWRWVDADAWERAGHDPVRMLGLVAPERLDELAQDGPFVAFLTGLHGDLREYLTSSRWYQSQDGFSLEAVAY